MSNQQLPTDPRDERIAHLEEEVNDLKLSFALQFGTDKVAGEIVTLVTTMSADLKDVKTALFGDASDTEKVGLLVRLDRLEQAAKTSRWWSRTFAVACVGELIYIIFRHTS